MRQAVIPRYGPPDVFEMREAPDPTPGRRRGPHPRPRRRASTSPTSSRGSASTPTRRSRRWSSATRSPATSTRSAPDVTGFADGDRVVALTRFGGYSDVVVVPAGAGFPLPRRTERRRGGGGAGQLPDRGAGALPDGGADAGRDRARPQRRRRRRHRRHAARPAAARDGDRHGVGVQARRAAQLRRRARDRLPPRERRRGSAEDHARPRRRRDPRSDRRAQLHDELPHAGAARTAGHVRPVGGRARRAAQLVARVSARGGQRRVSIRCR